LLVSNGSHLYRYGAAGFPAPHAHVLVGVRRLRERRQHPRRRRVGGGCPGCWFHGCCHECQGGAAKDRAEVHREGLRERRTLVQKTRRRRRGRGYTSRYGPRNQHCRCCRERCNCECQRDDDQVRASGGGAHGEDVVRHRANGVAARAGHGREVGGIRAPLGVAGKPPHSGLGTGLASVIVEAVEAGEMKINP
jgi:hypothetical protein